MLLIAILCAIAFILYKEYGMILCAMGIFLNYIAIAMNGNKMPVIPYDTSDYINIMQNFSHKYTILTEETKVKPFADIIKINNYIISIGDIIITIGITIAIFNILKDIIKTKKEDRAC